MTDETQPDEQPVEQPVTPIEELLAPQAGEVVSAQQYAELAARFQRGSNEAIMALEELNIRSQELIAVKTNFREAQNRLQQLEALLAERNQEIEALRAQLNALARKAPAKTHKR